MRDATDSGMYVMFGDYPDVVAKFCSFKKSVGHRQSLDTAIVILY
jgi:hypothetical protein